jgi:hypothetical protein
LLYEQQAFEKIGKKITSASELNTAVSALTKVDYEKIKKEGCIIYYTKLEKLEMAYVPQGWLLIEKGCNEIITAGARKSIFFKTGEGLENYKQAKELLKSDGKNVEKMDAVAKCLA